MLALALSIEEGSRAIQRHHTDLSLLKSLDVENTRISDIYLIENSIVVLH